MNRFLISMLSILFPPLAYAQQAETTPLIVPPKVSELNYSIFKYLYELLVETYEYVREGVISLADFVETAEWLYQALSQPLIREQVIEFSLEFSASLLIAFGVERLFSRYMFPLGKKLRNHKTWHHFWKDLANVSVCLTPIAAFGASFYASFRLLEPVGVIYLQIATIFINGITGTWAVIRASSLVFLPKGQDSHLPFSKDVLLSSHRWFRRIAIMILVGYFVVETGHLIGLPAAGHRLVVQLTTLIILVMTILLVWGIDEEFRCWLYKCRKKKGILPWEKRFLAYLHFSPILFVYLVILSYLTWVLPFDEELLWSWKILGTLLLFPLLFYGQHLIETLQCFWVARHLVLFAPELSEKAQFYQKQISFVLSSILSLIFGLFTFWFWGQNPLFFLTTEIGQLITEKILSFLVIIGVALFLLRAARGILSHYLDPKGVRGVGSSEKARMRTLHSILSSTVQVIVWVPAVLLILTELDIDILPAVATIGVLGVGLSFGIQTVVQDFVTGVFMLIENTFAVGDVVNVNGQVGSVESLTVRVLRLRSMDGTLSSFSYGKIATISNYSREYSVAVMTFTVGRDTNIEELLKGIRKLDDKLYHGNEELKKNMLEPLMIDGVTEVTDSAVTLRVRAKAKPKQLWLVKRIYMEEITRYLDQAGIPRAIPTQRVIHEDVRAKKK